MTDLSQGQGPWLPVPTQIRWLLSTLHGLLFVCILFLGANFFQHNPFSFCGSLARSLPILGFFFLGISFGSPMEPFSYFLPFPFCWSLSPLPEGGTYFSRSFSTGSNSPLLRLANPELKVSLSSSGSCCSWMAMIHKQFASSPRSLCCFLNLPFIYGLTHWCLVLKSQRADWWIPGGCLCPQDTSLSAAGEDGPPLKRQQLNESLQTSQLHSITVMNM